MKYGTGTSIVFKIVLVLCSSSSNFTGIAASTNLSNLTKACSFNCAQVNPLYLYHRCMRNCSDNWPFVHGGAEYDCAFSSTTSPDVPCHPTKINKNIITRTQHGGKVVPFVEALWTICDSGISFLKGFMVQIKTLPWEFQSDCNYIKLKPGITLNTSHRNLIYRHVFNAPLAYETGYNLLIETVPFSSDTNLRLPFSTKHCEFYNGPYSCFCPKTKRIPDPTVIVRGYTVEVRTILAKKCFGVVQYDFVLYRIVRGGYSKRIGFEFKKPHQNQTHISAIFSNIYDSNHHEFGAEIITVTHTNGVSGGRRIPVVVKAWEPPVPNITILSNSSLEAYIKLAPRDFHIKAYVFRLSEHGVVNSNFTFNKTISVKTANVTKRTKEYISQVFLGMPPGYYTVQVREARPNRKAEFNPPFWGEPSDVFRFPIPPVIHPPSPLPIVLSIIVPITFIVVLVSVLLYLWKTGCCQPLRSILPGKVVEWLDAQTINWSQKSVLLVWQTDLRSQELQDKHIEVICRLSSFLRGFFNLDVMLDLYDETELSRSISDWVQKSFAKADVVIFICPHFNYMNERVGVIPLTGDFSRLYSYAEKDIGDRSKYATVLLPYSDLNSTSACSYLRKMTTVFTLDQIQDLYLYIQGISKFDCMARHGAVSGDGTAHTSSRSWNAVSKAVKDFKETRINNSPDSSTTASSSRQEDSVEIVSEADPLMDSSNDVPPMQNSISLAAPPAPDDLTSKERVPLQPIVPFVENPKVEILKINKESMGLEPAPCPHHRQTSVGTTAMNSESAAHVDYEVDDVCCPIHVKTLVNDSELTNAAVDNQQTNTEQGTNPQTNAKEDNQQTNAEEHNQTTNADQDDQQTNAEQDNQKTNAKEDTNQQPIAGEDSQKTNDEDENQTTKESQETTVEEDSGFNSVNV